MSRRREPRVEMNMDVTVWGMDRYGKPFVQHARTLNATRGGARLLGIDCVAQGETVGIQHAGEKSRFRVVWVGRVDSPRAGQVGVQCLEDKTIFVQERPVRGIEFNLEKIGSLASALEAARRMHPAKKDALPSRRKYPRYHCTGGVEIRRPEDEHSVRGNVSDLCLTGCYVETVSTLAVGTNVLFELSLQDLVVRGRAVVRTSHHAVGMGLAFQHVSPEGQQHLEFLIASLAGNKVLRAEQKFQPSESPVLLPQRPAVQPAAPSIPSPKTSASPEPVITASTPVTAPASTATTFPESAKAAQAVSSRMMLVLAELSEIEECLLHEKVDARLVEQFHDALEHVHQTAWNVQRFLDLDSSGSDPFTVMPQMEAERVRMLSSLARNVTADIDSYGIDNFGQNILHLGDTLGQLERRLSRRMNTLKIQRMAAGSVN
ncbi:MAG TPA: PilZ domain-containing protein [Candidatus Angelobacter sp.]|nr:PilZ domain-containing protein [Candidatus Angelobacter sp.]